jgi:AraC-like DNA-binding protein
VIYPNSPENIYGVFMTKIRPLERFPLVSTNSIEKAEVEISRTLSNVNIIGIADRNRFQLQMNRIKIGHCSLAYNQFRSHTKIKAGLPGDSVYFIIGSKAPTTLTLTDESIVASSKKAAMITLEKLTHIERSENSEVLVLQVPYPELLHHFELLIGRHFQGSLFFDSNIDLTNGSGAILNRMINYVVDELSHSDLVLKNPGLLKNFDQMLLSAILSLHHNQRKQLYDARRNQVAPRLVRHAEEYMRAHLEEAISIIDLLRVCGCSRSALFSAFRNARGYTPMEFLTEQRLQSAREKLHKLHPEASVTSIALACGFINLGRFSQVYRKRFGERPSDTLRKG